MLVSPFAVVIRDLYQWHTHNNGETRRGDRTSGDVVIIGCLSISTIGDSNIYLYMSVQAVPTCATTSFSLAPETFPSCIPPLYKPSSPASVANVRNMFLQSRKFAWPFNLTNSFACSPRWNVGSLTVGISTSSSSSSDEDSTVSTGALPLFAM